MWNQAKEGRWPHCHPQLVQQASGGYKCSGFVVSLIPDPLMSLWFPCQFVLMELTVVMLLHNLISCSRTDARPSSVCLALADQGTTAVLNIDSVCPVKKKRVQDDSVWIQEIWRAIVTGPAPPQTHRNIRLGRLVPTPSHISDYTLWYGSFQRGQLTFCQPVYVKVINSN